jgi:hypothetical protein
MWTLKQRGLLQKLVLTLLGPCLIVSAWAQGIGVFVDGEPGMFSGVGPQKIGGRVLVPLRGVMEKLGAYVSYQAGTRTVTANRGDVDLQLNLGRREALLNGRTVLLDVPAMEYRGSTLVPLRFMGEALGAQVTWDAPTNSVRISTGNSGPTEPEPPTTGGIIIERFNVHSPEVLRAGSEIQFTLVGQGGGQATVQIPGVVKDFALRETARGTYPGTYVVPSSTPSAVTISRAPALARLTVGNVEQLIQSQVNFQVDNQIPSITATTPEDNGRVNSMRPNITAVFSDQSGTGIQANRVRMTLDGRDVTSEATVTANLVAYRPATRLSPGAHDVTVEVYDQAGNRATKTWRFTVVDRSDVITSFTSDAARDIQPGDEINFTLLGEPGSTVTLKIGDQRNITMQETSPGRYTASYVVRRADRLDGVVVSARLRSRSGETYSTDLTLGSRITGGGQLIAPTITSHQDGERVGGKAIFSGKADPNARVILRIDFTQRVLGAIPMSGTIGEVEITADSRGNWTSKEIDLDTGLGRSNITYTVTAVTVGEGDERSDSTKITLKR